MTESRVARLLLTLVLVGYPVFGLLAALLDMDSPAVTLPYRLAVLTLSGWLLAHGTRPAQPLSLWEGLMWVFLGVYGLRLLWDTGAGVQDAALSVAYFIGTVIVPLIALSRTDLAPQDVPQAWQIMLWGGATSALAVAMHTLGLGEARSLTEQVGRLTYEAANPILLGHAAVTGVLGALCLLQVRGSSSVRLVMGGCVAAALVCLALSASRGPALVLVLVTGLYALATGRWRLIACMGLAGAWLLQDQFATLEERLLDPEYDESNAERLAQQASALADFINNPVLGSAHVDSQLQTYPHNVVVETGMALGVAGLIIVLPLLACACWRSLRMLRQGHLLLGLLFWQFMVWAQLSGAIYANAGFWVMLLIVLRHGAPEARQPEPEPAPRPESP